MKFHSLRSLLAAVTALGAALLLGSCGGGGAGGNPNQGGPLSLAPTGENVTIYAGMPTTFQLGGGRAPYALVSGDAGILPLPNIVAGNSFTVVPNNPGVIDSGLQANDLPRRTISIQLRDSTGISIERSLTVAQNFLTGYGIVITPTTCPAGTTPIQACAGGVSAVRMQATFNGSLAGNRAFRFQVLRGNFFFRDPATGQAGQTIQTVSDHSGTVTTLLEVPPGALGSLAVLRVIDVATGVYADHVFTISSASPSQNLTAVPNTITFTGPLTTICGTGTADFFVFDGVAPYTAVSLNPTILVEPGTSNTNPGRFTVRATNPNTCVDDALIIVTDSLGGRTTVTVDTQVGTTEPPTPPPFSVGPTALTLGCGQSGSVAVVGGSGSYFTTSTNPNTTAVVSGNVVTITRANSGTSPTSVSIAISDGRNIATVTATVPATCP